MLSLKGILSILLGLYIVGLFIVLQKGRFVRELPAEMDEFELAELAMELSDRQDNPEASARPVYEFTDKNIAYKILTQLDQLETLTDRELLDFKINPAFNETIYGLKGEDDYCDRHRAYFVEYPESIFEEINVLLGRENQSFVTINAINGFANDVHPNNHNLMPRKLRDNPTTPIKVFVNSYFTTPTLIDKLKFGKHYSCLSQTSNHIAGSATLSRKDLVAQSATEYLANYETRPQCINYDKFFPETWRLQKKQECLKFFARFNSEEYKMLQEERRIVYIKKITGLHKGEGVQPLTPEEEVLLREEYQNGTLCGQVKNNTLMQHYVYNPLLINGRKFDFRMYMLVASTDPLMVYYHDGNLRVSLGTYTADSDDKKTLLTNIALNKEIYDNARLGELYQGMSLEELAYHQQWSFERLQEYLLQENIINDTNWLDNYLRPEFKKAMVHLTRMSFKHYHTTSRIYELYGVDFMLDENLNLWFIEANSGPAIKGLPEYLVQFISKMVQDHFRIEFGLLRSRMKRVIEFVNTITAEDGYIIEKTGIVPDLAGRRKTFDTLNRNAFEKEFEVTPDNGWYKIVDESLEGVERYQGFITEECL